MDQQKIGGAAQPRMLTFARESRAKTQGQLAESMTLLSSGEKVSQGYVSRAEKGTLTVSDDRLELYARALGYPAALLRLNEREVGAGPGLVHHRKKQAASAPTLRRIHAQLNLARLQVHALLRGPSRSIAFEIPHIPVDDYDTPEDAARQLRAKWDLPTGPMRSVVGVIEAAGALVVTRQLVPPTPWDSSAESVPVDAVSICVPAEDPIVLLNSGTPSERQRFTLAHELGHMVMHAIPDAEQEKQANRFAAELLMPVKAIRPHLRGQVTLARLLELKTEWKVSTWALLRRAHSLGELSDWQYRTLAMEMSSMGWRTNEPHRFPAEEPAAVAALVQWHLDHGRSVHDVARDVRLLPGEFAELYLDEPRSGDSHAVPDREADR